MPRRRPVPDDIAPAGRLAGFVTAACLAVVGVAFLVPSFRAMNCTRGCTFSQHYAALITVVAIGVAGTGLAIGRAIWRRPVDVDGDTGWTWGLAALFILGMMLIASRVPQHTCPGGTWLDTNFSICIDVARGRRFPAGDRIWLKRAIIVAGWVLGFTVIRSPRWVWVAAPLAAAAWLVGTGWLLADAFLR